MLNNIGLPGLILVALMLVLVILPFWKLMPKFGLPKPLALIGLIPLGALVLIWIMAFREVVPAEERV
jgi:hypothetical protein